MKPGEHVTTIDTVAGRAHVVEEDCTITVTIMRGATWVGCRIHYGEHWWPSYSIRMFLG